MSMVPNKVFFENICLFISCVENCFACICLKITKSLSGRYSMFLFETTSYIRKKGKRSIHYHHQTSYFIFHFYLKKKQSSFNSLLERSGHFKMRVAPKM